MEEKKHLSPLNTCEILSYTLILHAALLFIFYPYN